MGPRKPLTTLGTISLWLAALLGAWGAAAGALGAGQSRSELLQSARRTPLAAFGALSAAVAALLVALLRRDFNVALVAQYFGRDAGPGQAVAALFAAPGGRVLATLWMAAGLVALAVRRESPVGGARVAGVASAALAGGALYLALWSRPFARLGFTPLDGGGVVPILEMPGGFLTAALPLLGWVVLSVGIATALAAKLARAGAAPLAARAGVAAWVLFSAAAAARWWWAYAVLSPEAVSAWIGGGVSIVAGLVGSAVVARAAWTRWPLRLSGLGTLVTLLAMAALARSRPAEVSLAPGADTTLMDRRGVPIRLTHLTVSRFEVPGGLATVASLEIARGTEPARLLTPVEQLRFDLTGRPRPTVRRPALHMGWTGDLRVTLVAASLGTDTARYRIRRGPPVWPSLAGLFLLLAGGLAAWPGIGPRRVAPDG